MQDKSDAIRATQLPSLSFFPSILTFFCSALFFLVASNVDLRGEPLQAIVLEASVEDRDEDTGLERMINIRST